MLMNMFSSFDMTNYKFSPFIITTMFIILMFNMMRSSKKSIMDKMFMIMPYIVNKEKLTSLLFLYILILNFLSLNLFSFSVTSQLSLNIFIILSLWFPMLLMTISKEKSKFLIKLLPKSTKGLLIPMLILIEMISLLIRPLTLMLRLSINMIAGHVLMTLMSTMALEKSYSSLMVIIYMYMKFLVMFIQAFIISSLLKLYMEEIESD